MKSWPIQAENVSTRTVVSPVNLKKSKRSVKQKNERQFRIEWKWRTIDGESHMPIAQINDYKVPSRMELKAGYYFR